MLLVIDVGNTNVVLGIFSKDKLIMDWRIHTERNTTEDEFNILVSSLFSNSNINMKSIEHIIISNVVPQMVNILDSFCRKYLGHEPHWVNENSYKGMPILYRNPSEVGADRIVNAVAAFGKYRTSVIIIDFGTATTFDAVSTKGEYMGGAICPGIIISSEALFTKASKLPRVEIFSPPKSVIGKDTDNSLQSGLIYGFAGMVDGVVNRMKIEMKSNPKVIATGGLAHLIGGVSETIEKIEQKLTLEGLKIIANVLLTSNIG
jgi:type III pantothenate kinase